MTQLSSPERLYKTKEFEYWWECQSRADALQTPLDTAAANRWIRVRSLNEAIEAHDLPERFPVIVGPSGDADQAGGVEEFDWGR
jgi:hypothetical protein